MMQVIDTFSGVGGFSLAARWAGWKTVQFCEIDPWCQDRLGETFLGIPIHNDIKTLTKDGIIQEGCWEPEKPTIVVGGFPCQPFSSAGKRRGKEDDRYLWPAMLEVIRQIRPTWVVGENVAGFVGMGLDDAIADLAREGYQCRTFVIPACAVGASHRRNRAWIVAHANDVRPQLRRPEFFGGREAETEQAALGAINVAHADSLCANKLPRERNKTTEPGTCDKAEYDATYAGVPRLQGGQLSGAPSEREGPPRSITQLNGHEWPDVAARICRVDARLPRRVDRAKRLKALGNSIVPQVAYQIFKAINLASA